MIHARARGLLAALAEGDLPRPVAARVRGHVQGCARCRRILREHEACATWLSRLPPSLVPVVPNPAAEARLQALARWAAEPEPVWREHFGTSALGALAAAAILAMVLTTSSWAPLVSDPVEAATLAAVMPEANHYAPMGWR